MRTIILSALLGGFLCVPLFVFAQATTTQGDQTDSIDIIKGRARAESDLLLQNFLNEKMRSVPQITDLRTNAIRDYLEIKNVPQNPGPLEMVRVSVESYLTDLNKATIIWSLNGKIVEQGVGKKTFTFQNGQSGKTSRLVVSITTNTGDRLTKELSFNPVGVTILWEADTYTPPFYKGKALLSFQAQVRVIALPDNTDGRNALNGGNLVYVWEKDGSTEPEASGYGKNSFSFIGPKPYEKVDVRVRASSVNDTIKSDARVNFAVSQPFILFYEINPLLSTLYNKTLGTDTTLSKKEFSVSAEPYFFSNETSETSTLVYDWAINGKTTQNYGRTITLRNDTGVKGDSVVSLAMHGLKQTFQMANSDLRVHFTGGETSGRPIF